MNRARVSRVSNFKFNTIDDYFAVALAINDKAIPNHPINYAEQ